MEGVEVGVDFRKYVEALEEERRKIQVFRRELPLCLELITQAIDSGRQQLSGTTTEYFNRGQSECSEHNSGEVPVLEEFIPIKRSDLVDGDEESDEENKMNDKKEEARSDWLRSAQLWNQSADSPVKEDIPKKKCIVRNGGAFQPFQRDKTEVIKAKHQSPTPAAAASSTAETASGSGGGSGKLEEKEGGGQTQRKQRRCWSPELHKRFLHALQQLGGSHAATPKQIRELMKVDGLTNDEVKSHLQKYRLHTRRPSSAIQNNGSPQPKFVVVGGIWVPPPRATAETITGGTTNRVYAPVAARPDSGSEESGSAIEREVARARGKGLKERRVSGSEAGVESSSTATSVSHL